jgi:cathepsin B
MKLILLAACIGLALSAKMTKEEMISRLGTKLDGKHHSPDHGHFVADPRVTAQLPASFVAGVDSWPECYSTIFEIKNQAQCGSCWAVAASEVFEDRWCISCNVPKNAQGQKNVLWFAAEYLLSCCSYCGDGCQGGYPIDAMRWFQYKGIPTGGAYQSKCGCQTYEVQPGAPDTGSTPRCSQSCDSGYPISLSQDVHKTKDHYTIDGNAAAIQAQIMKNGPVECAFSVYENFYSFFDSTPQGVYNQNTGQLLGGHAIKIIGWGVDAATQQPYWLINNSWGSAWGMGGQFKYLRGTNLGGMEEQCVAADPKCGNSNKYSNELYCRSN